MRDYDSNFANKLKKTRPDWFKSKLLSLAKDGSPRPKKTLSAELKKYSSYDPEFTKIIKKIRPDWFGAS